MNITYREGAEMTSENSNDMTGKELQDFQTRNEPDATLKGEATPLIVVRCFGVVDDTHIRTDEVYVRWDEVKKLRRALLDLAAGSSYPSLCEKIESRFNARFAEPLIHLQSQWGTVAIVKMLQSDAEERK